jgi:hypothetical protein
MTVLAGGADGDGFLQGGAALARRGEREQLSRQLLALRTVMVRCGAPVPEWVSLFVRQARCLYQKITQPRGSETIEVGGGEIGVSRRDPSCGGERRARACRRVTAGGSMAINRYWVV